MANVSPFQPYRYTAKAGPLDKLVTQPYDKISPEMRERYLAASPHNLVRVILGKTAPGDGESENIYTRAAAHLNQWIGEGILAQDAEPCFLAYFQEFADPDTGERCVRKGFIGLGELTPYSEGIVHRHEQTLSGPKKDRLELLRHTQAHFGQIFMLYPDPEQAVDRILDEAARAEPDGLAVDDYQVTHKIWKIAHPAKVARIRELMGGKKLIIADGHHRYETALGYRDENPKADARRLMMTFVNMNASGLRILATHRLVSGLEGFDSAVLIQKLKQLGKVDEFESVNAFKDAFRTPDPARMRIGVVLPGVAKVHQLDMARPAGGLDVSFLHSGILDRILGIGEEAVREQKNLAYVRGVDAAWDLVSAGKAQVGFLLQATTVEQVADVSFGMGVMPQKSTDFFPKLLSGFAIYRLEK